MPEARNSSFGRLLSQFFVHGALGRQRVEVVADLALGSMIDSDACRIGSLSAPMFSDTPSVADLASARLRALARAWP